MKTLALYLTTLLIAAAAIPASSQAPIKLTATVNPHDTTKLSTVVVMPLFETVDNITPFEKSMVSYFNRRGLKAVGSLEFLDPGIKYPIDAIKHKCDSLGADAILVITYEGSAKTSKYIAPTSYYSGADGNFGGYWGDGYWGGYYGGTTMTVGGTWAEGALVYLTGKLYTRASKEPLWTGEIDLNNPKYIDEAGNITAQAVYSDWKTQQLLKKKH